MEGDRNEGSWKTGYIFNVIILSLEFPYDLILHTSHAII